MRIWSWQHVSVNIYSVAELSPVYCCLVSICVSGKQRGMKSYLTSMSPGQESRTSRSGWSESNFKKQRLDFKVSLRGMQASVMDLYLHGNLRIVLKPLLQRLPLVGGMQVSNWDKSDFRSDFYFSFFRCTSCTTPPLTLELEGWPMWQTCQGSVVSSGQHFNDVKVKRFWNYTSRRLIMEQIERFVVLPNKLTVPFSSEVPMQVVFLIFNFLMWFPT